MITDYLKNLIDRGLELLNALDTQPALQATGAAPFPAGASSIAVAPTRGLHDKGKRKPRRGAGTPALFNAIRAAGAHSPASGEAIRSAAAQPPAQGEAGVRVRLFESFLKASHGDLASFSKLHIEALAKDPLFYGHLARWYFEHGSIRDHQELFAAHLLTSPFPEHREHGGVLLQLLRPYQVERVVRYCKEVLSYPTRRLRSSVAFYLRRRENTHEWFDEHVIRRRSSLKYLYATLHIRPSARADRILFKEAPPTDSRVHAAKELSRLGHDPAAQARLIVKNRIHFTTALGAIRNFTPGVVFALAVVMTPQQVINNLRFLEKRGALDDADTRRVVEEKIRHGATESRVNDMKTMVALQKIHADGALAATLLEMTSQRLRNRGRITVPTAIFVDKSGSMEKCIEIGKLLATMCSTIAASALHVQAFDGYAFALDGKGRDFASWEKAFGPIRADGCTSIGAPLHRLMREEIDQVLIISDGEENTAPFFRDVLKKYEQQHRRELRIIFLKVQSKGETPLERDLKGKDLTVIPFDGDYYNLPNVVPLLCPGNAFALVEEVMQTRLYTREALGDLPPGFNEETFEVL